MNYVKFLLDLPKTIDNIERKLMDLQTGYNDLVAKVDAAKAAVTAAVARVMADVQALKDQITAGTAVSGDQLEAQAVALQGVVDALNALDPVPDPAPNPDPTPVP